MKRVLHRRTLQRALATHTHTHKHTGNPMGGAVLQWASGMAPSRAQRLAHPLEHNLAILQRAPSAHRLRQGMWQARARRSSTSAMDPLLQLLHYRDGVLLCSRAQARGDAADAFDHKIEPLFAVRSGTKRADSSRSGTTRRLGTKSELYCCLSKQVLQLLVIVWQVMGQAWPTSCGILWSNLTDVGPTPTKSVYNACVCICVLLARLMRWLELLHATITGWFQERDPFRPKTRRIARAPGQPSPSTSV